MKDSSLKLELMDWLSQIEDNQTLNYLKAFKDAEKEGGNWSEIQKNIVRQRIIKSEKDPSRLLKWEDVKHQIKL